MQDPFRGSLLVTALTTLLTPVPMLAGTAPKEPAMAGQVEVATIAKITTHLDTVENGDPEGRRVWTNDDFAAIKSPDASGSEVQKQDLSSNSATRPKESEEQRSEENAELQRARLELGPEIAPDFQARDKALDETIATIRNRLELEKDGSRMQAFQKLLDATISMQKMNREILEQLGFQPVEQSGDNEHPTTPQEKPQS